MTARKKRPEGRPPTGVRKGEKVSDYCRVTLRVPDDVRDWLVAASGALNRPQWRVMVDAILAYVGEQPPLPEPKIKAIRHVWRTHRANGH